MCKKKTERTHTHIISFFPSLLVCNTSNKYLWSNEGMTLGHLLLDTAVSANVFHSPVFSSSQEKTVPENQSHTQSMDIFLWGFPSWCLTQYAHLWIKHFWLLHPCSQSDWRTNGTWVQIITLSTSGSPAMVYEVFNSASGFRAMGKWKYCCTSQGARQPSTAWTRVSTCFIQVLEYTSPTIAASLGKLSMDHMLISML